MAALGAMAALTTAGSAQAQTTQAWDWTNVAPALRDVACATPQRCVAVGQEGVVLHTTGDPAAPLAWSGVGLAYPEELAGAACSATSCLAVSNSRKPGALYVSTVRRSVDGGATWSAPVALPPATIPSGTTRSAIALACDDAPSAPRCYAVGPAGGVWSSTDDGRSWSALRGTGAAAAYRDIDCAAPGTCLAVSGAAGPSIALISDTTVAAVPAPAGAWAGATAVGCDTATRCTVADTLGRFASLSLPSRTWSDPLFFPRKVAISELSCPAAESCVGLATGIVMRTTALSAADGGWRRRPTGDAIPFNLASLACVEATCVAAGKKAMWSASADTGSSWGGVNVVPGMDAVQCAFGGSCVGGGKDAVGVSRSGGMLWTAPLNGVTGLDTKWIGCSDPSTCMLLGRDSSLFTSDLRTFDGRFPATFAPAGVDAVACATLDVCVGLSKSTLTTLDGARTAWGQTAFVPSAPKAISCWPGDPGTATCVATAGDYVVRGTMAVVGGRAQWAWTYTDADPDAPLVAVGCSPAPVTCTAAGPGGEVWYSDDPALLTWTGHTLLADEPVDTRPALTSAACVSPGVCMVGGAHGGKAIVASTTDAWGTFGYDEIDGIEGAAPTISGFSCETADRCVAVGDTVLVGARRR